MGIRYNASAVIVYTLQRLKRTLPFAVAAMSLQEGYSAPCSGLPPLNVICGTSRPSQQLMAFVAVNYALVTPLSAGGSGWIIAAG